MVLVKMWGRGGMRKMLMRVGDLNEKMYLEEATNEEDVCMNVGAG